MNQNIAAFGSIRLWQNFTLRMIAGHEVISSGSVIIDGQDISEKPPSLRPTSMMFQNYALFPHLKVIDNVAFALKISGIDKLTRHERAMEMLRGVQLEKLANRFPNQLSGGSSNGLRLLVR